MDRAVERLCELLSAESGFADGLLQRVGEIAISSLKEKYGDQIDPTKIVARLSAALTTKISALQDQHDVVDTQLTLRREYEELTRKVAQLRADAEQSARDAASAAARAETADREVGRLRKELAEIGEPSGLFAGRKARRRDELVGQVQAVGRDAADLEAQHQVATAEQQRLTAQAEALERKLSGLRPKLSGTESADRLAATVAGIRERLATLQEELRAVSNTVRANCRVMATTVAKAIQSRFLTNQFDTVVIDEAGMVNLPRRGTRRRWQASA